MRDWKKSLAMMSALAVVATATSSFNLTANAVTDDIYEFEDGTLSGATSMTGDRDGNAVNNASGGLVFLENSGETATVTVTVSSTGMYDLTIGTYTPYGNKTHSLLINGVDQGSISFEENTEGVKETSLGMYKLNEGENTITVQSSWGWTYLDYIKISDAVTPELTATKTLSDSEATDETKRLMSYLVDNYGEHILSGQQEIYKYGPHDFEYEFEYIKDLTGVYPAIRGFDFMNSANPLYGSDDGTVDRMIEWANDRNGIVTASWHITVPKDFDSYTLGESVAWADSTYVPSETNFDPSQILVEGSKEREYYMLCLEQLASCIQELQDAGVPLIFRPLHEAEGGGGETGSWFWWGKSGSAVYKELWKLTYDTLTEDYGLHNIIWEWNSYAYSTSTDWYPGDEYVDIVAYDKYNCTDWSTGSAVLNHNDSAISGTFYNLVDMYPGKMVAMSENDSIPTLENLTSEKAGWLYFLPWYDGGSDDINFLSNPIFNTTEDLITMYQSDYCISLDELPEDLYTGYSLVGFVDSDPKDKDDDDDDDDTKVTTTTTAKAEEKVVTIDASDCTETDDGFKFTVEDPENITKIEILGSISDTDDSSWYCGGGGVVFGLGEDDDYAFLDYMFNKGDSKVTVKVNGTFKSGETDADGANIETTGTIHSNTIEITKWWGASANDDTGANVSMDITGVKVYYKESTAETNTTTTAEVTTTEETTTTEVTTSITDTEETTTEETTTTTGSTTGETKLGDVNLDGNIRVNDIQEVRQWLLHTIDTPESTEQAFINADVTQDTNVRVNDIQLIRQYILHIIDSLDGSSTATVTTTTEQTTTTSTQKADVVYLGTDLEPDTYSGYTYLGSAEVAGKSYSNVFKIASPHDSYSTYSATFKLDGNYTKLKGFFGTIEGNYTSTSIKIVGDNNTLFSGKIDTENGTSVAVDVTGVESLTISVFDDRANTVGFADFQLS